MSGTSMDAVDIAMVEFDQHADLLDYRQYPIPENLKQQVRAINGNTALEQMAEIDHKLGQLFADAVNRFLTDSNTKASSITAIGSHGQTVYHRPEPDWRTSLQLGDANVICARTGIGTVADFRRMDMACNGQGAPLAPAFHRYQFRGAGKNRTVLNIGGIANISILPADETIDISGFDTGPGNGLLDDWNYKHNQTDMDRDSQWAGTGKVNDELLREMMADPYFALSPPKSTGRDYFNMAWLQRQTNTKDISPEDIQATLLEFSMQTIAQAIETCFQECEEIYVCGGGASNPAMLGRLQALLPSTKLMTTEVLGIHPDAVEAVTFAWLAYCRINETKLELSSITGADRPILAGAIYKGVD